MQKVVFENNLDAALAYLKVEYIPTNHFGEIKYYSNADVEHWCNQYNLHVTRTLGVRTFFALNHDNEIKYREEWQDKCLSWKCLFLI